MRLRGAALVVCGVLVYANSLDGPFILDDATAIVANTTIRSLEPIAGALSPPRDTPVAARPLVNLTFALNYAAGGLGVRGYHVVNVVLHVLAGLLLAGLVRRTLRLPALPGVLGSKAATLSWAAACVWLLHPLNSEVVNYVTQRTEGLMAVLYFSTLYAAVRALEPHASPIWGIGAVVSCAAGMASKESMVTAPVMVALYDRVFVFASVRQAWAHRRRLYVGLAATWVVLIALMATAPRSTVGFAAGTSAWTYLLNQAEVVGRYLWLTIWPRALVVDYGLPRAVDLADVVLPGVVLVACAVVTIVALVRVPAVGFLGAWFFVTLAPTSSVVPIATEVGAERRMYLPLAGLVVLAVVGGYWLAVRRWPHALNAPVLNAPVLEAAVPDAAVRGAAARGAARASAASGGRRRSSRSTPASVSVPSPPLPVVASAVLAAVCAALAAGTLARNAEYGDPLVLAETVVARRPHGRAHFGLADELVKKGQPERVLTELRLAIADYPQAHFGLANELAAAGNLPEAIEHVRQFIRLVPHSPMLVMARDLYGRLLATQGQLDSAATEFAEILRVRPDYLSAAEALGDIRSSQRRFAEAASAYGVANGVSYGAANGVEQGVTPGSANDSALGVGPARAVLAGKLGRTLVSAGRASEAIPVLRQAVAAAPGNPDLRAALGQALAQTGQFADASSEFRQLLALVPDHPDAARLLARAEQEAMRSGRARP